MQPGFISLWLFSYCEQFYFTPLVLVLQRSYKCLLSNSVWQLPYMAHSNSSSNLNFKIMSIPTPTNKKLHMGMIINHMVMLLEFLKHFRTIHVKNFNIFFLEKLLQLFILRKCTFLTCLYELAFTHKKLKCR